MTRVTLTLNKPLANSLREEAASEDRTVSSIARRAFKQYFEAKKATPTSRRKRKEAQP